MKESLPPDYAEFVRIQSAHLSNWAAKLKPDIAKAVAAYVRSHNNPDTNFVLRGQDIVQVILDWPTPSAAYPPRKDTTADVI